MSKRSAKTMVWEIPTTTHPPDKVPDQELGRQWNELYPPGTEVIYSIPEVLEPHHSSSHLVRTASEAKYDPKRPAGWRDYVDVDGDKVSLRGHIFPASAFPDVAKKIQKQPKENPAMKKAVEVKKESPEATKQRQLDDAYSQLHEVESRLFDAEIVVKACQAGIKEWSFDLVVIERLLFGMAFPVNDPCHKSCEWLKIEEPEANE